MLVFIDESGDAGFNLAKGSSPVFAIAMIVLACSQDAADTARAVSDIKARLKIRSELKFANSRNAVREAFFADIASAPFYCQSDSGR